MDEKKIDETRLDQRCNDAGHWHFAFFDSARAVEQEEAVNRAHWYWLGEEKSVIAAPVLSKLLFYEVQPTNTFTGKSIHSRCSFQFDSESLKIDFLNTDSSWCGSLDLWDTNYWRHLLKWFCHWEHMEKYSRFAYYFEWRVGRGDLSMLVMQVAVFDNDVDDCVDFVG